MTQNEFIQLINPFKDKVYRLAKRLLVSREEAEDATQEVLLKLWNKQDLQELRSIEAMAIVMTKNYCFDQLKSKRAGNLSLITEYDTRSDASMSHQTEDRNSLEIVNQLINQLPEQQRIILQMREIEEYEFETIAETLGMNETAVRVALSRARKTLREKMTKIHNYGIRNY